MFKWFWTIFSLGAPEKYVCKNKAAIETLF